MRIGKMKLKKKAILTRYERWKFDSTNIVIALMIRLSRKAQIHLFKAHMEDFRFHELVSMPICMHSHGGQRFAAVRTAEQVLVLSGGDADARANPLCQLFR